MPASDIVVKGAREHNLRDVSLVLPRNKLICLTGVSGSGKSSLAFDTLYRKTPAILPGTSRRTTGVLSLAIKRF